MLNDFGISSLFSIISHLIFIGLAWWALQSLDFEKFLRKNHVAQARLLYIFMAVALGTLVSNFFLDYLRWADQLIYIFQ
ncbi:DUF1146 family protein [Bacillus kwashiorkori]|uniref:DUF1146 family protein n=1 Tax=Bacillus kwashiorkori TaxID=1522318 RepID=UPI0007806CE0|nr:DUF1146 family protein [Bacillus kwashiorkori]